MGHKKIITRTTGMVGKGVLLEYKAYASLFLMVLLMASCNLVKTEPGDIEDIKSIINPVVDGQPNILWIVAEDLSAYIPSFGDSTIITPHLSKLAAEGVCYDNFYSPHPVCAPARAAIITGMYANSIGASHMRTGPWYAGKPKDETQKNYQKGMPENIKPYEAVPASNVKMFTEYLRAAGYYCSISRWRPPSEAAVTSHASGITPRWRRASQPPRSGV